MFVTKSTCLSEDLTASEAESGFTLIELVVTTFILFIVMVMASSVLYLAQRTTRVIGWQAESNSELRRLMDEVFADVETARPAARCQVTTSPDPVDIVPFTCTRVVDGDGDGPVLLDAGQNHVCYFSHRVDPAFVGKADASGASVNGKTLYQRVCLVVLDDELHLVQYAPNLDDMNARQPLADLPTVAVRRKLGNVVPEATTPAFSYLGRRTDDLDSATPTDASNITALEAAADDLNVLDPTRYGFNAASYPIPADKVLDAEQLALASRVDFNLRVVTGQGARERERTLQYRVTLRGARYQTERCWTGEQTVNSDPTNTDPRKAFECAPL